MSVLANSTLFQYLTHIDQIERWEKDVPIYTIKQLTFGIQANRYYFGHPEWAENYFQACHRDSAFTDAWKTAIGSWQDKIVVDVGCGPGNVYAALKASCGTPQLMIGVDVSLGGLKMAQKIGYAPVLADAHNIPLASGFADIVVVNATLHHCDDMGVVLAEAARLVRPGGLLITDHDPQHSAWYYTGLGLWLWNLRLPLYRWIKRGGHASTEEQYWGTASEIHHKPQAGIKPELFCETLEPMGFTVKLYPHNHNVGAGIFQGTYGRSVWKCRVAQRLSGINPDRPESALSLMCIARR
jgi:ubiquinone/menaquinone biosynthesis C-methylase UbiE